jgi:AcrR family transcriptional regulator
LRQKTLEKRNKFLTVGKKLFFEKGYINVSVKEICDQLKTTTGSFYFMFSSKEKLLEELLLEDLGNLWAIGNIVNVEKGNLNQKIKSYFKKSLEFITQEIDLMLFYENLLDENGIGGKTAKQIKNVNLEKQEESLFALYSGHKDEINHKENMIKSLARYTVLIFEDKCQDLIEMKKDNLDFDLNEELDSIVNTIEGLIRINN